MVTSTPPAQSGTLKPREQTLREWGQFAALLFGGVWAIVTFYYKDIIVPRARPAALVGSLRLEEVGRKGRMSLVRAHIGLANRSESKVWVPALWYTAVGVRLDTQSLADSPYVRLVRHYADQVGESIDPFESVTRHAGTAVETVLAAWKEPEMLYWFEPNDEMSHETMFYVPTDRYDAVWLNVDYIVTKSIDPVATIRWSAESDGSLWPQLYLKRAGFDRDTSRVELFEYGNPHHAKWAKRQGLGHTGLRTMLALGRAATR